MDSVVRRERMEELLGGRDPLRVIADTPEALARLVGACGAEVLRGRRFEGKWTPSEILGHLGDAEWVYGCRLRFVLSENELPLTRFDQDEWVSRQRHNERDPAELLETFASLRRFNLALWRRLTPADFDRKARRKGRERVTVRDLLRSLAGHDLWHLDQLERYLA